MKERKMKKSASLGAEVAMGSSRCLLSLAARLQGGSPFLPTMLRAPSMLLRVNPQSVRRQPPELFDPQIVRRIPCNRPPSISLFSAGLLYLSKAAPSNSVKRVLVCKNAKILRQYG